MRIAAIFVMSFVLALLVLTLGALSAITYHLRRAPEGFEDNSGFHFSSSEGSQLPRESGLPLGAGIDVRTALEAQLEASRRRIGVPQVREAH